ncbi:uncharacterized protein LOC123452997 [Hordeum vulgare subsp. vulgare]|uniref:uncharacterized protein LOC123452997 n=1 Tax=Hordeum vulgare subsp. vulgare TaxID=112509 RepID=UPI001D1A471A|nr:uncharacterized protein LOC123452997 [Hordeum vulgare subsp. vulgare]
MTPRHAPIWLDSTLMAPNPTHNLRPMARVSGVRLRSRLPCRPPLICGVRETSLTRSLPKTGVYSQGSDSKDIGTTKRVCDNYTTEMLMFWFTMMRMMSVFSFSYDGCFQF